MLPATLAQEVKHQLLHYLEATFPMRNIAAEEALGRFFNDPVNGLFKGPWVQLRKPFRQASSSGEQFFDLKIPFTPFKHQWQAWQRLTDQGLESHAPYALCLGYRIRFILDLNAREAMQLIELRSGREGHPTYRAVAIAMRDRIANAHPSVAALMTHVDETAEPRLERMMSELRSEARGG